MAKTLNIPPSDAKTTDPIKFTPRGSGLVISDIHVPYHDEHSLFATINHAIQKKHTDFVIINGDGMDCYQLSQWCRDPRKRNFAGELDAMRGFLKSLTETFKHVWYKAGNHETRYERYLGTHAPELIGVTNFDLVELLKLKELKVRFVPANAVIHAGALSILHGHEYGKGVFSPVNPARGMFLRAKACTLSGHQHQTSHHNETDIRGLLTSCWSTGCLCDLHPEYAPLNRWDHGFGLMSFDGKLFDVSTHRIVGNRVF